MKLPFPATRSLLAANKLTRREILKGGAATSLVVALPACGADENPASGPAAPSTSTAPETASTPTTTSIPTSSPTTTGQPSSPPAGSSTAQTPPNPPAQPSTTSSTSELTSSATPDSSSVSSSDAPSAETTADSSTGELSSGGSEGATTNGELIVPPWDDVPVCDASRTDGAGQGPFFIHNEEKEDDVDLFRQDIRGQYKPEAEAGIEMHLHLRILDSTSTECNGNPVPDVEVYIWHTDPQGYYSGFGNPGDQKPDEPYAGVPNQNDLDNTDRFCRGAAVTDANGVVSFRTYFPGWYNGRDLHIHFVALKKGSAARGRETYSGGDHLFTTQFYFDPELSDAVHKSAEPYLRRTQLSAYPGSILADEQGNSGLHAKATFDSGLVVAQMQILLDPKV